MSSSIELAARLSGVVSIQQDILAAINDPDRVMQVVAARAPEVIGASGIVIELAGRIELDDLASTCVREKRTVRSGDVESDPRTNADAGVRSVILTPLVHGNIAIGVVKAFSPRREAFDDLDAYTLQLIAGMTSSALMQAREFRERQVSEARYRMLFERNVAGVFRSALDGRFLDCNDALVSFLGYNSREELLAHQTWDLYHQRSDREQFLSELQRNRTLTNLRLHLKRKDGTSVTGVVNASILPADDGDTQVLGTFVEA